MSSKSVAVLVIGVKSASFLHQASCYQAETRARVVMLNSAAYEANRSFQESPLSVTHTIGHPTRSQSREHGGLMSWPDQYFKPTQPHEHPFTEINEHAKQLLCQSSAAKHAWQHGNSISLSLYECLYVC